MLNHSRLKAWVQKIRGVVTCYLDSYLGWFRALDREKGNGLKPQQWLAMAISERANKMICEHSQMLSLPWLRRLLAVAIGKAKETLIYSRALVGIIRQSERMSLN